MQSRPWRILLLVSLLLAACDGTEPGNSDSGGSNSGAERRPLASTSVAGEKVGSRALTLVAAGDIARRPSDGRGTARLIASIDPDAVLALGDNAYENGSLSDYRRNYDPTWGRFKKITRPVPGNHEYRTRGAAGYLAYFDRQVDGRSYYAWDAGHWRMYALSCGIDCGAGSRQLAWLRQDLAANADRPALAYVHEPLYTCSTRHPPTRRLSAVWSVLQRADGRIMLAGHNHAYERFAKQDATGRRSADGLRQFVVGTGGVALYPVRSSCRNRLAAQDDTSGVLVLRLGPERFSWRFVAVSGQVLDRGRGRS